jgi:hypothetical protein
MWKYREIFFTLALVASGWSVSRFGRTVLEYKTPYLLYRNLGGQNDLEKRKFLTLYTYLFI